MDYPTLVSNLAEALKWPATALVALIAVFALRGILERLIEVTDRTVKHIVELAKHILALLDSTLCLLEKTLPNTRVRWGNKEIDCCTSATRELSSSLDDATDPSPGD